MMNVLKKYWWILLSVILIPCLINLIMIQPRIYRIVGNDTSWLSFWGGYIGSVISSAIALFILWKQLNQNHQENEESRILNHQENEDNRKLQLKNIEYQQKTQWLNLLRSKYADCYSAFCIYDLTLLEEKIFKKENQSDVRNEIKVLLDRMTNANFSVGILFPENIDSDEKRLLCEINKIMEEFYAMLSDLYWYVYNVAYLSGGFELNESIYKEKTDKYIMDATKYDLSHDRIWDIIIAKDYNIFDKHEEIVLDYFDLVFDVFNPNNVQRHIANLIDYEQNKIDKILS